jgi:hypothetical protein
MSLGSRHVTGTIHGGSRVALLEPAVSDHMHPWRAVDVNVGVHASGSSLRGELPGTWEVGHGLKQARSHFGMTSVPKHMGDIVIATVSGHELMS